MRDWLRSKYLQHYNNKFKVKKLGSIQSIFGYYSYPFTEGAWNYKTERKLHF